MKASVISWGNTTLTVQFIQNKTQQLVLTHSTKLINPLPSSYRYFHSPYLQSIWPHVLTNLAITPCKEKEGEGNRHREQWGQFLQRPSSQWEWSPDLPNPSLVSWTQFCSPSQMCTGYKEDPKCPRFQFLLDWQTFSSSQISRPLQLAGERKQSPRPFTHKEYYMPASGVSQKASWHYRDQSSTRDNMNY